MANSTSFSNDSSAEKLTLMKLNLSNLDRELSSGPATPTANRYRGAGSVIMDSSSRSRARANRQVSRTSRRSSSVISSHRNQMSAELTSQAESKFLSLMEFTASASREAASLKEFWAKILAEREAYAQEREELVEQFSELTEEIERRDQAQQKHGHESGERKKQIEKILVELSTAIAAVSLEKKKLAERDLELVTARHALDEVRASQTRTHADYEKTRGELEIMQVSLKAAISDRDSARDDADKHQRELHRVSRERTDISGKLTDITITYESTRKELVLLTDRIQAYDVEREAHHHEVDRMKEESRRARLRADETARELLEVTEKYERVQREATKIKDTIRLVEAERDEYSHSVEQLRREIKSLTTGREEAEERYSEINIKYEHTKRELLTIKERLRDVELERNGHLETVERTREQYRLIVVERDELKDDLSLAKQKADDHHRRVLVLTESLSKSETTLSQVRSEVYTLTERVKLLDRERDDIRQKNGHLSSEIIELQQKVVIFQAEIRTISEARDSIRNELEKTQAEFEEVTETMTTYKDDSAEYEFEIESLRTLLRESREQKELAISARNTADRERDEYITKFENKCRELERFEESAAAHYHANANSSGHGESHTTTTTSRMVRSSGAASSSNANNASSSTVNESSDEL